MRVRVAAWIALNWQTASLLKIRRHLMISVFAVQKELRASERRDTRQSWRWSARHDRRASRLSKESCAEKQPGRQQHHATQKCVCRRATSVARPTAHNVPRSFAGDDWYRASSSAKDRQAE